MKEIKWLNGEEECHGCNAIVSYSIEMRNGRLSTHEIVCPHCKERFPICNECENWDMNFCKDCICGSEYKQPEEWKAFDGVKNDKDAKADYVYGFEEDEKSTEEAAPAQSSVIGGSNYDRFEVQVWDIVEMYGLDFFEGNILKYLLRTKGDRSEDIRKIISYCEKYLKVLEDRKSRTIKTE